MFKVQIISVGKQTLTSLEAQIKTYMKRMEHKLSIEWIYLKNDEKLVKEAERLPHFFALDERGILLTSEHFSQRILERLKEQKSRIHFIIGGAEGLPESIKKRGECISLSKMTFPHQICRLLLTEQLYRALEIDKGTSYHKA